MNAIRYFMIVVLSTVFLCSCSQNEILNEPDLGAFSSIKQEISINGNANENYSVSRSMVEKFLRLRGREVQVRQISPVIEDGDTLAFYVEYNEGWELLSADERISPVIAKSSVGRINWTDTINPGVKAARGMLNAVRDAKSGQNTNKSEMWKMLEPSDSACVVEHRLSKRIAHTPSGLRGEGSGKWIIVDTLYFENTTHTIKLINTHWGQEGPWGAQYQYNQYTPYQYNSNGNLQHTLAGCVAVAAAQAINFIKANQTNSDSIPYDVNMPYVENGVLSVNSFTNNWSILSQTDNVAKFLSYCGKLVNMSYGLNSSDASATKLKELLDLYHVGYSSDFGTSSNQYNYLSVCSSLLSGSPVLIAGKENSSSSSGHAFIIDGYQRIEWYTAIRYMWDPFYELTEWDIVFGDPTLLVGPMETGKEVEGDYSTYVYRDELSPVSSAVSFSMNWGWGNYSNEDNHYYLAYTSHAGSMPQTYNPYWVAGGNSYTFVQGMIYNLYNIYNN